MNDIIRSIYEGIFLYQDKLKIDNNIIWFGYAWPDKIDWYCHMELD